MKENPLSTPIASRAAGSFDLSAMTMHDIEQAVSLLTPKAPDEMVLSLLELTAALKRRAVELRQYAEQLAVAWIETNGDLVAGPIRYYAGHHKETKCLNQRRAIEALLSAVSGDLDAFCLLLAARALKPGACRGVLDPEQYAHLFQTERKVVLKDGKVTKRLIRTDERFNGCCLTGGEEVEDE